MLIKPEEAARALSTQKYKNVQEMGLMDFKSISVTPIKSLLIEVEMKSYWNICWGIYPDNDQNNIAF